MDFKALKVTLKPLRTTQLGTNRRPQDSSKFSIDPDIGVGRSPKDIRPRWKEPIPPFHEVIGPDNFYAGKKMDEKDITPGK